MTPSTLLAATLLLVLLPIAILLVAGPPSLTNWARRKHYRWEVTVGLYMLTPGEKFAVYSIIFLTLAMVLIAAALYLPEHIATVSHRAFYYYSGLPPRDVAGKAAAAAVVAVGEGVISSAPVMQTAAAAATVAGAAAAQAEEGARVAAGVVGGL